MLVTKTKLLRKKPKKVDFIKNANLHRKCNLHRKPEFHRKKPKKAEFINNANLHRKSKLHRKNLSSLKELNFTQT